MTDLEKLREEIAREIYHRFVRDDATFTWDWSDCEAAANDILALPAIADLLRMKAIQVAPSSRRD